MSVSGVQLPFSQFGANAFTVDQATVLRAEELIRKHFDVACEIQNEVVEDPETGERMLELGFAVRGETPAILQSYDGFTSEWVKEFSEDVRRNTRIVYSVI